MQFEFDISKVFLMENFEAIAKSEKPLDVRANYSRKFLSESGISEDQFTQMAAGAGVTLVKTVFQNDEILTKKIFDLQGKLNLKAVDSKEGRDGMLGPYTLGRLKTFVDGQGKRMEATENPAEDLGAAPEAPKAQAPEVKKGLVETPEANIMKVADKFEGSKFVQRMPGNGGRQVLVYVPKGFDPSKPAEIAYHFHGTHSHLVDIPRPPLVGAGPVYKRKTGTIGAGSNRMNQALSSIQEQVASGKRNVILVYPLSAGRRGRVGGPAYLQGYDDAWMKKGNDTNDDMAALHNDTLKAVKEKLGVTVNNPAVTVSGHSAGGTAIRNILNSGFKPDKVKFLDATYGSWLAAARQKIDPNIKFEVYVRPGTKTEDSSKDFSTAKNMKYVRDPREHGLFVSGFI